MISEAEQRDIQRAIQENRDCLRPYEMQLSTYTDPDATTTTFFDHCTAGAPAIMSGSSSSSSAAVVSLAAAAPAQEQAMVLATLAADRAEQQQEFAETCGKCGSILMAGGCIAPECINSAGSATRGTSLVVRVRQDQACGGIGKRRLVRKTAEAWQPRSGKSRQPGGEAGREPESGPDEDEPAHAAQDSLGISTSEFWGQEA